MPVPTTVRRDFKYAQSDRVLGPLLRYCCCLKFLSATHSQTHYAIPPRIGTCAKLRSFASALCCALHLLMFCFHLLRNTTIPKRRETLSRFPHGTQGNTGPRYPLDFWTIPAQQHWTHLRPTFSWNPSPSGNGFIKQAFGERCHFAEVNVAVLFAPSIPPLCPGPSAQTQIPHFPSPHRISTWYSTASLVPPQAGFMCGLPWAPFVFRTHKLEAQEMQLLCGSRRECLRRTAFYCWR